MKFVFSPDEIRGLDWAHSANKVTNLRYDVIHAYSKTIQVWYGCFTCVTVLTIFYYACDVDVIYAYGVDLSCGMHVLHADSIDNVTSACDSGVL